MPNKGRGINGQWPVAPVTIDSEIHQSEARNQPKPAAAAIRPAPIIESARASITAGTARAIISGTRPNGGNESEAAAPATRAMARCRQGQRPSVTNASVTNVLRLPRDTANLQQCQPPRITLDHLELQT